MTYVDAPSYRFSFFGGLSQVGSVERVSPAIDDGAPHQFRYVLDDRNLASALGKSVTPAIADLIDVCAAISLADRLSPRSVKGDARPVNERWPRYLKISIPVRLLGQWQEQQCQVEELAGYLSGDAWTVQFIQRSHFPRSSEGQALLLPPEHEAAPIVALHSGGLDSLFGLIEAATSGYHSKVYAVSVVTHGRSKHVMNDVLAALRPGVPTSLQGMRLHTRVLNAGRQRNDRESSHRTRVLLYLAAGIAVGILAGTHHLQVTENGPGAVNLPCTISQIGGRATRSMHPKTLAMFAQLTGAIMERPIIVTNTGLYRTKGELAQSLLSENTAPAAQKTVSCDRFPYWPIEKACGTCSSCLYRRIALNAAGLPHLDRLRYTERNLLEPGANLKRLDLVPMFAQRTLDERLRILLATPQPFAALWNEFVEIDDLMEIIGSLGLEEHELETTVLRLFKAHVRHNDEFFAHFDHPTWNSSGSVTHLDTAYPPLAPAG